MQFACGAPGRRGRRAGAGGTFALVAPAQVDTNDDHAMCDFD